MSVRSTLRLSLALALLASAARAQGDPARDGPHLVRQVDLSVSHPGGGSSTLRVYLPAAADRPRPVVLVIHGLWTSPHSYQDYAQNLATRGYAAALYDQYSRISSNLAGWVAAGSVALDGLAHANGDPRSGVMGELDLEKVAVMGHSYGGMTALGIAANDRRAKVVVAVAPGAAMRSLLLQYAAAIRTAPVLVITGQSDGLATAAGFGRPVYRTVPSPHKLYVEIAGGSHMGFIAGGGLFSGGSDAQRAITRRYGNAWLDRWLLGAADPQGYTDGRFAARDGALSAWEAPVGASSWTGDVPGRVTTEGLNARSGPGTQHPVQAVLAAGQELTVHEASAGWYRVSWSGAPAGQALWVSAGYVQLARQGTVTADELNVRSGPGTQHGVVTTRRRGEVLEVLEERQGWLRVRWSGAPAGELWVSGAWVSG